MSRIFKLSLLIFLLMGFNNGLLNSQEMNAQQNQVQTLQQNLEQAKKQFEEIKLEYQKTKLTSRDWDRRDKAEDNYIAAYETYQNAQHEYDQANLNLTAFSNSKKSSIISLQENKELVLTLTMIFSVLILCFTLIFLDFLTSYVARFVIHSKNGFKIGDKIEVGNLSGEVTEIGFFRTSLEVEGATSDEEIITLPNQTILKSSLHVHPKSKGKHNADDFDIPQLKISAKL